MGYCTIYIMAEKMKNSYKTICPATPIHFLSITISALILPPSNNNVKENMIISLIFTVLTSVIKIGGIWHWLGVKHAQIRKIMLE